MNQDSLTWRPWRWYTRGTMEVPAATPRISATLPTFPQSSRLRGRRRGEPARRACAAGCWAVGLFLLVQLCAGIVLDRFGLPLRFAEASAVIAQCSPESNPEVILLGSSRFLGGVAADEVARCSGRRPDAVLNAAVPAGDAIAADLIFARLLDRGARPTLVVIEVSPDTLNHRSYWLRYHLVRQLTWADVPRYARDVIAVGDLGTLLLSRLLPLYYFRHQLVPSAGQEPERPRAVQLASARVAEPVAALTPEQLALSRTGLAHASMMMEDFHTGGLTAEAMDRLLNRCGAVGARVLLVGVPVTSLCRSTYTPEIDAAYRHFLAEIVRTHGCRFVDCRACLPDNRFIDFHHLSLAGARDFSRLLAREIEVSPSCRVSPGAANASAARVQ